MLRKLFILDCNLEEIKQDAFSNIKCLNILDLSHNRFKRIEKNTFSNLKNLQVLDLSKNELKKLLKQTAIRIHSSFKNNSISSYPVELSFSKAILSSGMSTIALIRIF